MLYGKRKEHISLGADTQPLDYDKCVSVGSHEVFGSFFCSLPNVNLYVGDRRISWVGFTRTRGLVVRLFYQSSEVSSCEVKFKCGAADRKEAESEHQKDTEKSLDNFI